MFSKYFLYFLSTTFVICQIDQIQYIGMANHPPLTYCENGQQYNLQIIEQKLYNSEQFSFQGYELELLVNTFTDMNYNLSQYEIICLDYNEIYQKLLNQEILFALGGIRIDYSIMDNFDFTLPTVSSGLKFAMKFQKKSQLWSFFEPFSSSIWVIILFTTLIIGVINFLFEEDIFQCRFNKKCFSHFNEMIWQILSALFFAQDIRLQKISSRILLIVFLFAIFIVWMTYTANLTSILSQNILITQNNNLNYILSNPNINYFTQNQYINGEIPLIKKSEIRQKINTYDQSQQGLNNLFNDFNQSNGDQLNIIIMDIQYIDNLKSKYPCSTIFIDEIYNQFNFGFVFNHANNNLIQQLNENLYLQKQQIKMQVLYHKYINVAPLENYCKNNYQKIELSQIIGLWIIILIFIIVALIMDRVSHYIDEKVKLNIQTKNNQKITDDDDEQQQILDGYLKISEFIHIPSKKMHQKVNDEITENIFKIEEILKERYDNSEQKVVQILQQLVQKKTTIINHEQDDDENIKKLQNQDIQECISIEQINDD